MSADMGLRIRLSPDWCIVGVRSKLYQGRVWLPYTFLSACTASFPSQLKGEIFLKVRNLTHFSQEKLSQEKPLAALTCNISAPSNHSWLNELLVGSIHSLLLCPPKKLWLEWAFQHVGLFTTFPNMICRTGHLQQYPKLMEFLPWGDSAKPTPLSAFLKYMLKIFDSRRPVVSSFMCADSFLVYYSGTSG